MSRDTASRKEEALWLLEKVVPGSAVNNLSVAFRVDGRLDPEALRQSLRLLLRRYPVLRTAFHAGDDGLTKTVTDRDTVDLESAECTDERTNEALAAFVARPFALSGTPLVRALLLHGDARDHFCLAVHHLVFDTISGAVLLEELTTAYTAFATGTPLPAELREEVAPLPETQPTPAGTAFWRGQLSGFDPEGLALWVGEAEVANPTLHGDQVLHQLSAGARDAVQRMAKELRASEAVVLLAAYYLLLARHGAGPDLVVGSPVNVRGPRAQRAIGYHVNVLPLRVAVDLEGSFADLVRRVRQVFMGALAHADVPVDVLLEEVPRRDVSWHNALFRHVFNYVPGEGLPPFELAGLAAEPVVVENGFSKFDLEFFVLSSPESIGVRAAYCVEAFARADVAALLRRYDRLLQALGQDAAAPVGEVDLFSPDDREIVDRANGTGRAVPLTSVLDDICSWVLAAPDATALESEDRRVSYGQLWQAARETAAELRAGGIAAGDVVAVLGPRGPELAAAVLGVWLVRAAYLPLDPSHPADRLRHQLDDARTAVVLAADPATVPDAGNRAVLPLRPVPDGSAGAAEAAGGAGELVPYDAGSLDPDSCAYLIYTSGSTGLPKGALISHRNLKNLVTHFADQFDVTSTASLLWLTTFSFDISALELFVPLVRGGRVVVAPDRARTDGRALAEVVVRHRVDTVQATPTTWRLVVDGAADALSSCRVLCGGEPLPRELARRLASVAREVWNVYGPTETTIWSTAGRIDTAEAGPLTVGRPITNTQVFIADPAGHELPVGVLGELCVAGDGVALGYHNRSELTAARFARHPRYGRHYRTGDLARWLPGGTLHVVGRTDRQVKLRGNRIELPEVEAVLLADPDVCGVAAVVVGEGGGDDVLVAFVQGPDKHDLAERLWDRARARLPLAAVPSAFHFMEAFPMTGNDKVDYPALTRLAEERRAERRTAADRHEHDQADELLSTLVSLWRELLDRDDLDHRANFFTVGGHSLLAARLAQRVEEVTGIRIPMADVFAQPTPQRLAEHLRTAGAHTTGAPLGEAPEERGGGR
ncbi:amino acid adenylation domain-containing protein [Streptomyces sp. TG1A-8]|uniref:non-ribosomal peptide synthetase n=1 Tax=Streptomyces sp. TG1A-8 TaxID=3051385 RepID=UPI00265C7BE8|nr:amino acid adenylation domain-containing protein [Streptomyces sp. TG1A-8]MDO0929802.1 amino acid adenylation domain-containing protein [Streptomyces sp. TG1A-8]